ARVSSPAPGRSILITSAPRSARICVAQGPASTRDRSRTRMDDNAPGTDSGATVPAVSAVVLITIASVGKRRNSGDGAPEDQGMDVVRAFVGIHDFQIDQMPCNAEFVRNTVSTQHVARHASDVQCLAAGIALD